MDVLDCPKADVKVENRVAELLNAGPAVTVISGQIADQRGQPGTKSGAVFGPKFRPVFGAAFRANG